MAKAAFWTTAAVLFLVLDFIFEPNADPYGVGHGLFAWAFYGPWIVSYWLRNRHRAFMWIHSYLYLDTYLRLRRVFVRVAPIAAAAAAMEMDRISVNRNRNRY